MGIETISNIFEASPVGFAALVVGVMVAAGSILGCLTDILLSTFGVRGASRKNGEV